MSQRPVPRRDIPDKLRVRPGSRPKLLDSEADRIFGWDKDKAVAATAENLARLEELQYKMYADGRYAMLIALQAIDGGGKDSTIRRVFGAFNPQGCTVTAFKAPSAEELRHDYLWRIHKHAPPKGEIAVFNRSHYEDVLVVRVNDLVPEDVWSRRYEQINEFERLLGACGTRVVKIFLQVSKEEQRLRFQDSAWHGAENVAANATFALNKLVLFIDPADSFVAIVIISFIGSEHSASFRK